jgi:hypothetical protein
MGRPKLPTTPPWKRTRAALTSSMSDCGCEARPKRAVMAETLAGSPQSQRERSSMCVACSTSWPPDCACCDHQAGAGVVVSQ